MSVSVRPFVFFSHPLSPFGSCRRTFKVHCQIAPPLIGCRETWSLHGLEMESAWAEIIGYTPKNKFIPLVGYSGSLTTKTANTQYLKCHVRVWIFSLSIMAFVHLALRKLRVAIVCGDVLHHLRYKASQFVTGWTGFKKLTRHLVVIFNSATKRWMGFPPFDHVENLNKKCILGGRYSALEKRSQLPLSQSVGTVGLHVYRNLNRQGNIGCCF